jgi:hypothetical protein
MSEETWNNDGVECPYCHHVHGDSWEITGNDDNEHEIECVECRRAFLCSSVTSVDYQARPIEVQP